MLIESSVNMTNVTLNATFAENVELDAQLVLAGMMGGMDGIMNFGYIYREIFITTNTVVDRCEWLKKQSDEYITKVSQRAAELEASSKSRKKKNKRGKLKRQRVCGLNFNA